MALDRQEWGPRCGRLGGHLHTLSGLHTEGDTIDEARAMAEDAIRGYLECLIEDGEEIPVEHGAPIMQRIAVSLAKA